MKQLLTRLQILIAPFSIGIYVTLFVTYISWSYYINKNRDFDLLPGFYQFLSTMDQKSVDFRIVARGPRKGSDRVALLTIDEKAVTAVGRWPWPREVIAKAYENAIKYGAKVIALDAVFSEPSSQPAQEMISSVRSKVSLSEEVNLLINAEIERRNSDRILAETIARHSDKFVMGTFFEREEIYQLYPGHIERCRHLIFKTTSSFGIWDREEAFPVIIDDSLPYFPDTLATIYQQHLGYIASQIRQNHPTPTTSQGFLELQYKISNAQEQYCTQFLDPENDELYSVIAEAWPQIKNELDVEQAHFEEWAENFKSQSFQNAMSIGDYWVMNTELISAGARHTAFFNALQDPDGSIRRARLLVRTGTHYMPALAFKAYIVAMNYVPEITFQYDAAVQKKVVKDFRISHGETGEALFDLPVDRSGNLIINFAGPQKMFPYISMADLLTNSETSLIEQRVYEPESKSWIEKKFEVKKSEFLKDKILVFGATATGIYDLRVTPFDENFPGAETHVNIIDNLLRQDFLTTSRLEENRMPLALLGIGIVLSALLTHLGAISGILLTLFLLVGTVIIDEHFFFSQGIVIAIIFPLLLISGLYVVLTFYKYLTEERGKRELKQTFQKYVSPAVVDEILADPENIELGGKKVNLTVFFSDVRGFTTISEKLDPKSLSDLLNFYLTPMTEIVFKNKGTLDKYMGDAVMAFFGAPIHYPNHAASACRCALQSLEKLKEIQAELEKRGLPMIDIGIGLNTGDMSVGNMGSETVRSYTVMGDAVNLGSRLEGINKQYGTRIIISEFTYAEVKDDFVCREIDLVRVKGKVLPVKIYELVAEKQVSDTQKTLLQKFNSGYHHYHQKRFQDAIEAFNQGLDSDPSDPVSKLYIKRCEDFISKPPPADWDGVFIMTSK